MKDEAKDSKSEPSKIFTDVVVFIDMPGAEKSKVSKLAEKVKKHGGKVSQINNKNTTHVIWDKGSPKNVISARGGSKKGAKAV